MRQQQRLGFPQAPSKASFPAGSVNLGQLGAEVGVLWE